MGKFITTLIHAFRNKSCIASLQCINSSSSSTSPLLRVSMNEFKQPKTHNTCVGGNSVTRCGQSGEKNSGEDGASCLGLRFKYSCLCPCGQEETWRSKIATVQTTAERARSSRQGGIHTILKPCLQGCVAALVALAVS